MDQPGLDVSTLAPPPRASYCCNPMYGLPGGWEGGWAATPRLLQLHLFCWLSCATHVLVHVWSIFVSMHKYFTTDHVPSTFYLHAAYVRTGGCEWVDVELGEVWDRVGGGARQGGEGFVLRD
jgi:hypothetical protein